MLAIFYSILEDEVPSNIDISVQVAMLINLKLLGKTQVSQIILSSCGKLFFFNCQSSADRLDGVKCKCQASHEFVRKVSRTVRFELGSYLFDFVD